MWLAMVGLQEAITMHTAEKIPALEIPSHARTVHLEDVEVGEARERLLEVLGQAGFSVLSVIDLADLLRRRIDLVIEPHFILEVCRPELAGRAMAVSSDASLLIPCKIALWAEGDGSTVAMIPPARLIEALGRPHLEGVGAETEQRLEGALVALRKARPRRPHPGPAPAPVPAPSLTLSEGERTALVEALRRQIQSLLVEAAGTSKHELQHELAGTIDQLDALVTRLATEGNLTAAAAAPPPGDGRS
jgi:uncharacterized protein (DUF302 family)